MKIMFDSGDQAVLRARFGLAASATDQEIGEAIKGLLTTPPAPTPTASREAVRSSDDLVARHFTASGAADGHDLIAAAVADERIPRSRADHYAQRYAEDPEGTAKLLERLTPGSAHFSNEPEPVATPPGDSSYPPQWLPEIHGGRRERIHGGD